MKSAIKKHNKLKLVTYRKKKQQQQRIVNENMLKSYLSSQRVQTRGVGFQSETLFL